MARVRSVAPSLFPFLSVLACTIGALVVLLAVLSLASVETRGGRPSGAPRATAEPTTADPPKPEASSADPEAMAWRDAEARWQEVDRRLAAVGWPAGATAREIAARIRPAARSLAIAEAIEQEEARARRREVARAKVEQEIEALEALRERLPLVIDASALAPRWRPFFVECEGAGITAHRVQDDLEIFVARDRLRGAGSDLDRYLRRLQSERDALLVLLVRGDGLPVARETAQRARALGIRVAQLPLPGSGAIDWTLLRNAQGAS